MEDSIRTIEMTAPEETAPVTAGQDAAQAPERQAPADQPERGRIHQALCEVMGKIPAIAKTKEMKAGNINYKYRGIDDLYNGLQPLLAQAGIFILPDCLERRQQNNKILCRMRYRFMAADGSHVSCEVIGEANDAGDKGTNKCMSIAMKYALMQMFCIPTADIEDPDGQYLETDHRLPGPPDMPPRPAPGQQNLLCDRAAGKNVVENFRVYLRERFGNNYRAAYSSLSEFFDRRINSVDQLTELEMRGYIQALAE